MLDARTSKPLPNDHPLMVEINRIWDSDTTYAQRRAFIEVTLKNSRNSHDLQLANEVVEKFSKAR